MEGNHEENQTGSTNPGGAQEAEKTTNYFQEGVLYDFAGITRRRVFCAKKN